MAALWVIGVFHEHDTQKHCAEVPNKFETDIKTSPGKEAQHFLLKLFVSHISNSSRSCSELKWALELRDAPFDIQEQGFRQPAMLAVLYMATFFLVF